VCSVASCFCSIAEARHSARRAAAGRGGVLQGGSSGALSGGSAGQSTQGGGSSAGSAGAPAGGMSAGGAPPSAGAGGAPSAGAGGAPSAGAAGMNAGGGGMPSTTCPTRPPTDQACTTGLSCSYGTDLRPACRNHYDCEAGMWNAKVSACKVLESCAVRDGGVPQVPAAASSRTERAAWLPPRVRATGILQHRKFILGTLWRTTTRNEVPGRRTTARSLYSTENR
jgi:hypothetical protein